jgi:hypothetical protein
MSEGYRNHHRFELELTSRISNGFFFVLYVFTQYLVNFRIVSLSIKEGVDVNKISPLSMIVVAFSFKHRNCTSFNHILQPKYNLFDIWLQETQ